jgi:carbamoyltransferase
LPNYSRTGAKPDQATSFDGVAASIQFVVLDEQCYGLPAASQNKSDRDSRRRRLALSPTERFCAMALDSIWIQPAASVAGNAFASAGGVSYLQAAAAVGKAVACPAYRVRLRPGRDRTAHRGRAKFAVLPEAEMIETTAQALAAQKAVGWFQGRMEFGPRSLGARSILGDPRSPEMQRNLNLKVKYRESFRPFAPAVLREDVAEWFDLASDSPYMLIVADVKEEKRRLMSPEEQALFGIDKLNVSRSEIPAVTHVDYSARIQTVHHDTNPAFHQLLSRFKALTGCPILVNTSFNVRGEPIVCTPEDAFRCFMGNELDLLVIGNCVLHKAEQNPGLRIDYSLSFEPD